MSWPRSHLLEIGEKSWCPSWLQRHEQLALTKFWSLRIPGWSHGSPATQACAVMKKYLRDLSSYTIRDICAGAGGPSPVMELELNKQLEREGKEPVQFILSDLYPHQEEWARISKKQGNISYIAEPIDARAVPAAEIASKKECRVLNLCFHHFSDEDAGSILKNAIESADALIIFEMSARDIWTCLFSFLMVFWTCLVTIVWYWYSPLHLFFTFIVPVAPIAIGVDGFISCLRTRTFEETRKLLDQPGLDLSGWTFHSGKRTVQFPFIILYYYVGIKSD
ncbi:uncharacterized protein N7483_009737 [Penicillium malachiteum]|uniref:uncharacterized protein n=1 Tax=Penicillium malachiteum TaxID=1324776 RepID=UPI0025491A4B|nr:uncharacterized protein N7483_009737 [Penicillium malachiteum]KAJ5721803.1 hypothetical protein N7483_009737 [Penicillium malachiteum]